MTVAQHVAHAARVIDRFMQGAFDPEGFDMNFEDQIKSVLAVQSLTSARDWFEKSIAGALTTHARLNNVVPADPYGM